MSTTSSSEKTCIIEGVLNDESSSAGSAGSTRNAPTVERQGELGANRPSSSSSPETSPSRKAARRRPRTMSVENLSRTLSTTSIGSLVNTYLRRNISKPRMAKREEAAEIGRDTSVRSRRSVGSVAEVDEEDTDDTDVIYI